MSSRTLELNFTDETIKAIGNDIIKSLIDHLPDFIDSGVRRGVLPENLARDIAQSIAQPEEACFDKLEINFHKARGQLHKRVREYVYKNLPTALGRHGAEHYGLNTDTD